MQLSCGRAAYATGRAAATLFYVTAPPGDLEAQADAFVAHYNHRHNHRRYHESLANLTPADVYFGRGQTILLEREKIKRKTIEHRRLQHRKSAT